MTQNNLKKAAAQAAIKHLTPKLERNTILGIGTGSTANYFIDLLAEYKLEFEGAVASSQASADRLKKYGIAVYDLNNVANLEFYIDGADEINKYLELIKGGGGALTQEKVIASAAKTFICIADESKLNDGLGNFPLAVEVLPIARSYVARQIIKLGGDPIYREGFVTDNGNVILDIHNLTINNPHKLEEQLNNITGTVCNGLFVRRKADLVFLATSNEGVQILTP